MTRRQNRTGRSTRTPSRPWRRPRGALAVILSLAMVVGMVPQGALAEAADQLAAATQQAATEQADESGSSQQADDPSSSQETATEQESEATDGTEPGSEQVTTQGTAESESDASAEEADQAADSAEQSVAVAAAPVAAAAQPSGSTEGDGNGPSTLTLSVTGVATGESTDALVLGDNRVLTVTVDFVQATTPEGGVAKGSTITVTLPDYYSFDPSYVPGTVVAGKYTIESVSSDTGTNANASDNVMVLAIPVPASPQDPALLEMGFTVNLNTTAIDDARADAERDGTWTPNGTADVPATTGFKVVSDDNGGRTVSQAVTYALKDYEGIQVKFNYYADVQDFYFNYIGQMTDSLAINEHGKSNYASQSYANNPVWVTYSLPDPYTYGIVRAASVTLAAPDGFTFNDWNPIAGLRGEGTSFKNLTNSARAVISADGKTVVLTWSDDWSDASLTRVIGDLHLMPDVSHWTQRNQDAGVLLPSGSNYAVEASIAMADGRAYPDSIEMNVTGYYGTIDEAVWESGVKRASDSQVILEKVAAGTSHTTGDVNPYTIEVACFHNEARVYPTNNGEYYVPASDGAPTTCVMTLDSRILATDVTISGDLPASKSFVADDTACPCPSMSTRKVSSLTYYTTAHPEGVLVDLSGTTLGETFKLSAYATLASGEYLTKVSVTYSTLAYASSTWSSLVYSTAPTAQNGDLYPIDYTMQTDEDGTATTPSSTRNYILVDNALCPTFAIGAVRSLYINGRYGDGSDGGEGFALKVTNDFLGDVYDADGTLQKSTGVLTQLVNPSFDFTPKVGVSAEYEDFFSSYFTNGKVYMSACAGGGWTAEVTTISAAELKAGGNTLTGAHTYAVPGPASATGAYVWDLYSAGSIPSDQVIVGLVISKEGTLDISSLSNAWDGSASGVAVDKTILSLGIDNMETHPVTGLYQGAVSIMGNQDGSAAYFDRMGSWPTDSAGRFCRVKYDNCIDDDERHAEKGGYYVPFYTAARFRGAELIFPKGVSTSWSGQLTQDSQTHFEADVTLTATVTTAYARLYAEPGESVYLRLTDQQYASFVTGTAKIDGVPDPDASVVEVNGSRYLKVTYRGDAEEKAVASGKLGSNATVTYEPWRVTFDMYAAPTTPTDATLRLFDASGSWLDLTNAGDFYTYASGGTTYQVAIQSRSTEGPVYDGNTWANTVNYNSWVKDDPLSLYSDTAANDLHWALPVTGYSLTPNASATTGVIIQPGVSGQARAASVQPVKSYQEGSLDTAIEILAGKENDVRSVETTIKIPRAGDVATTGERTTVDLYLTGPITVTRAASDAGSTDPVVTYSTDGGVTFVDASAVTDWSSVTHVHVSEGVLKVDDAVALSMPLRTASHGDGTSPKGCSGEAYMEAPFLINGFAATGRLNEYSFSGETISGAVWYDANHDGMMGDAEAKVSGAAMTLWKDYGTADAQQVATTVTDVDGTYSFSCGVTSADANATAEYRGLTAVLTVPSDMVTTTYTATTDSKFSAGQTTTAANQRGIDAILKGDATGVDAGVSKLVNLTYDGNGETSGSVPAATTVYTEGTTVTVLDNTGASADPAAPYARTGYAFSGWDTQADGTGTAYAAGDTFAISADTTLYARWKANDYLVSYVSGDPDEGSVTGGPETVAYGGRPAMGGVAAAPAPGYRVGGWAYSTDVAGGATETGETADPTSVTILGDTTFTARFVADGAQTYDVAYVSAGGGTVDHALDAGIQVLGTDGVSGSTATPAPGYRFEGWYVGDARVDGAGATLGADEAAANVASSGGVRSDTTFTARFVADGAQTYDVAYVSAGGGTVDHALDAGIQVLGTDGVSGSTATPAPGYRFEGWYVGDARVDGAGAALGADEAAANVASSGGVRSDTTFTARFVADGAQTYDVAYVSAGGGTVDHALDAGIQVLGTDGVSGSTATPAPGYRFEGWYVGDARVDGAGAALGADEAAANVASSGGVRSDTTFTARFVADGAQTYDVAYVSAGGGTVDHALDAGIQVLGTDGVSGSTATPAPGYRFEGWYVGDARVDGAGAALGADEAAANVASSGGVRSDTTFTARFVADGAQTYDVAYVSAGGGTVDHALDAGIQVLGTDGVSGSTATPAPGYRFEGWYVGDARVDGAGAALGADEAAANVASSGGVRSDTTFTARFVADGAQTYDVAYVSAGGGTVDHALDAGIQVLGTDGVSGSTATPAPGYRFEGWYVGDARVDGAGAALGADEAAANVASSGGVRSDTTFTARFVADGAQTYDVAYVSAGGGTVDHALDAGIQVLGTDGVSGSTATPAPGYRFEGWYVGDARVDGAGAALGADEAAANVASSGGVRSDTTFTARFVADGAQTYDVAYVSAGGGTVDHALDAGIQVLGTDGVSGSTATPAPGYRFEGWYVGDARVDGAGAALGADEAAANVASSGGVRSDTTFTARFVADGAQTYDVAYVSAGGGTVDHALDAGIQVLGTDGVSGSTATPAPGYRFEGWYVGDARVDGAGAALGADEAAANVASSGGVRSDTTFTARFVADGAQTYDVAYVSAGGGTVDHALDAGIQVLGTDGVSGSTATPAPGYRFEGWYVGDARVDGAGAALGADEAAANVASSGGVRSDTTFTARFVADGAQTYDVAYVSAGGGTVDHALDAGIQVLGTDGVSGSTATPAPGYRFEGWYVGDARVDGAGAALGADEAAANVASSGGVRSDTTFTARFVADGAQTYDVAYVSAGGGTVDHALDAGIQVLGTDGVSGSTATPAPGYRFEGWYVGDARVDGAGAALGADEAAANVASSGGVRSDTTFTARFVADGAQTYAATPLTGDATPLAGLASLATVGLAAVALGLRRRRGRNGR